MNKRLTQFFRIILILLISGLTVHTSFAQSGDGYTPEKIEAYKAEVQNLVDFLEFSFNTLGNPATTARDKDVIINQSFAKIFVDGEVQVEDDLDENRETLINKDVQAYLKDIDFFFKEAVFSLNVSSIDHHFKADKEIYFIVTLTRTLNAMSVTGDTVSSNRERFIEVNYDDVAQDLRIASIYTTRIDEKDEFFSWWNEMPQVWRDVIGREAFIKDTISLSKVIEINDTMAVIEYYDMKEVPVDTFLVYGSDTLHINETELVEGISRDSILLRKNFAYRLLQRIASETEIDISGNLNIRSLAPLAQMGEIRKVNCANTLIDDLSPLRNLIGIESLDCSGTAVSSLAPMQYSVSLVSLDIHSTMIADLSTIANLRGLERINLSNTPNDSLDILSELKNLSDIRFSNTFVSNIDPLINMSGLRIINFSGTYVKDLSPLRELNMIERLYFSNTAVDDLAPLSSLDKLQTIYFDSTNVTSLQALSGLIHLESIYCDNTGITGSKANKFMAENPDVLVVHESIALAKWWDSISVEWQWVFRDIVELDSIPGKEQLHHVSMVKEVNISGNKNISTLAPLRTLVYLHSLDCSNTGITDLWPLSDLVDLHMLVCSNNSINNCEGLRDLLNLEYLDISNTSIPDIQCISRIKNLDELNISNTPIQSINVFGPCSLNFIYADASGIGLNEVISFKKENPDCIIVYQTDELQAWWDALNPAWQEVFLSAAEIKNGPSKVDLQRIADLAEIDLGQRKNLESLAPLQKLYQLHSLKMNDTQISDLSPIEGILTLETLYFSDNPIKDITAIASLTNLKHLEFENTPVSNLTPLSGLGKLEILNMAGTKIKKLTEVSILFNLRQISFYNTGVKSLKPIEVLTSLEHIKCYNTRLSAKKVRKFKEILTGCEIIYY
ncbi:MAG: leucine-rich repeat domain-containing protein [Bacteroidota bacterium]